MPIPSRHSNPFATCWTRPGAAEFVASQQTALAVLASRLASAGWRGQIIGPHGCGKSTLLAALVPHLQTLGRQCKLVSIHDGRTREAWQRLRAERLDGHTLLVVDGYEQLGPACRALVRLRCRVVGAGLLITAHRPIGLPTLAKLAPQQQLAREVFSRLQRRAPTPVTEADFHDAFSTCNGNLREVFFKLYDLHELRSRTNLGRTSRAGGP